eukprot:124503-Rhodomonas_salina.1
MVQQVVKLAENHLAHIDLQDVDAASDQAGASSFTVRAELPDMSTTQSGLEEQVSIQAGTICTLEELLT